MHYQLGLVGQGIAQSPSPRIHQAFAKSLSLSIEYTLEDIPESSFETHIASMIKRGFQGCNVTTPFKARALTLAHEASDAARRAGAANTLLFLPNRRIFADNTDGEGLVQDLQHLGYTLEHQSILILGAGGAVSGILEPLLRQRPQKISLYNRTPDRALDLQKRFPQIALVSLEDTRDTHFNIIIDGTSNRASLSLVLRDLDILTLKHSLKLIYDLKYCPSPTALTPTLAWAKVHGITAYEGSGMLIRQAALSFERWTGMRCCLLKHHGL